MTDPALSDVRSAVNSVKELVVIVTGLTITTVFVLLFTSGSDEAEVDLVDVAFSLLLVLNVIRFYHGNVRHLDHTYLQAEVQGVQVDHKTGHKKSLALDLSMSVFQCILLAATSFYVQQRTLFVAGFLVLLATDVFWSILTLGQSMSKDAFQHKKAWLFNNLLFGVALGIMLWAGHQWLSVAMAELGIWVLLCLNTAVDFFGNREFYFPTIQELELVK